MDQDTSGSGRHPAKIKHVRPTFTPGGAAQVTPPARDEADDPLPVVDRVGPAGSAKKIRAFEGAKRHEEQWQRTPNTTGSGAIHVRTFHSKITDDALKYMDQVINEWLDAHPQYEVKFVNSTVGILTAKLKEPTLICQVWV